MNLGDIPQLKARYGIAEAWADLGLPGTPAKSCRSPFPDEHKHGDAKPSFSVTPDGMRWKDFATGAGGDVIDLVAKARAIDNGAAIAWIRERLGRGVVPAQNCASARCPALCSGSRDEHAQLARVRNVLPAAVALAVARGFVHFGRLWGHAFWAVTDKRRQLAEFRRLDGKPWPAFGRLAERKSHCIGTGKNWPVGILEAENATTVAWFEGAPDFLAFWHFAVLEGKTTTVAPVAMLGAANHRVAADALPRFRGKQVVLYPHCDDAGRAAARSWARQLDAVGAKVSAFDLSGLEKCDGTAGKDLNDVCDISPDCFEKAESYKFREVLP